jgi:hypothetical protein
MGSASRGFLQLGIAEAQVGEGKSWLRVRTRPGVRGRDVREWAMGL